MEITEIPPKLRWACRRGMLELDVLLGNFLQEAFLTLNSADQDSFVQLLSNTDQDLFIWLTAREPAPEATTAAMIGRIRDHAQNRHST
jgi:antitoxin CptB